MNPDDHRDQLIDMLLREAVGGEAPIDVRDKVLEAVKDIQPKQKHRAPSRPTPITLRSARPSRAPIFAIAAILIISFVSLSLLYFKSIAESRTPSITSITGTVSHPPGKLHSGDTIQTGPDSSATLLYPDGTQVEIRPQSTIIIPELALTNRSKLLEITTGGLQASVAPQGSEYPMTLTTEHAHAIVVGTKLSFEINESRTRLEVTKGEVHLEPKSAAEPIKVTEGKFAEADHTATSRTGHIEEPTPPTIEPQPEAVITGFTLIDASTNQPIGTLPLQNGQTISLSSLPKEGISIRAEVEGERPFNVLFTTKRSDGKQTGLQPLVPQHHPPYFLTGDYSQEKRPQDCRPWTPKPGTYHITAAIGFRENEVVERGEPFALSIQFEP